MSDIVYWSLMTPFFLPCLSEYSRATLFLQGQKQSRILPFSSPYQLIKCWQLAMNLLNQMQNVHKVQVLLEDQNV